MPDSPSKKKWEAENILLIAIKLNRSKDKDIINFIENKNKHDAICEAVRYCIEHHEQGE